MDWIVLASVIATIIVGIVFLIGMLRTSVVFVDEGYQAVIYQLGRFHRLDGPGRIVLNKRVDKIHHQIDVRNMPRDYRVEAFSYGIPFSYAANFWRRVDLARTSGGNRERLIDLALLSDGERHEHVNIILRDTLVQTIASMERDHPLSDTAAPLLKILPILPGIPQCEEMLARWKQNLRSALPRVGVYLDPEYPLVVKQVFLGEDITSSLSLKRRSELLRPALPGIPDELLLQALTSIAGYEPPQHISKLHLDSNQAARVELRPGQDGELSTRIKIDATPPVGQAQTAAAPAQAAAANPTPRKDDQLTAEDLAVLKRIPSVRKEQSSVG